MKGRKTMSRGAKAPAAAVRRIGSNRHPVDRLGEVREEIARLKMEEAALREEILLEMCGTNGSEWEATVETKERRTLDQDGIRRHFGMKELAPFVRIAVYDQVTVRKKLVR